MAGLMDPWEKGSLSMRNRLWMAPVKTGYGTPDGHVTERHLHFYRRVALGGVGLVVVEPVPVRWDGREHPKQLSVTSPDSAIDLARLTTVIHEGGALAGLNLNHAGRAANPKASGTGPVAPSDCRCPAKKTEARRLEPGEIEDIVYAFGRAAAVAEAARFDLVEIQAGHGYLIDQFLDPEVNRRADRYGTDPTLFAEQVLKAAADATGLPLSLRVTLKEPGDKAECGRLRALLKLAEQVGISFVHVGMGDACTNPPWYYHHGSLPESFQEDVLRAVHGMTSLPVIAAGRMGDFKRAGRILDENMADAVALGRPLVADPDLPRKWKLGAFDEVIGCGYCLQGCLANVVKGDGLGCIVNPTVGRAPLSPPGKRRRVLVAGAGPAGLSAAIALWEQGHGVIVAEAGPEAGGTFRAAPMSPGKETMDRPLRGLIRAAQRAEIPVIFGQAVDEAFVKKVKPEVLVWAAGGEAVRPAIAGMDALPVLTSQEFYLEGRPLPGERVLIVGGGMVGLEAAEKLALEGREVVVVEMLSELSADMDPLNRTLLLKRLRALPAVHLMTDTTVVRIDDRSVTLRTPEGEKALSPVESVLLAAGMRPKPVPDAVRALVPQCLVVGDAAAPRNVTTAVRDGYEAGASL
jgi:2,4-dienoyl-CoA reductase-like NADH-dependent reductase (Old Yellow Enzyme family)/thioredoxin reductase